MRTVMFIICMLIIAIVGGITGSAVMQVSEDHEEYSEWCEDGDGEMVSSESTNGDFAFEQCKMNNGSVYTFEEWLENHE